MKEKKRNKTWIAMLLVFCLVIPILPVHAQGEQTGTQIMERIVDLTTNYLKNPIGIDTNSVCFGWKMKSAVIGARQTAYQIKVYQTGGTDRLVWDSGKVQDSRSVSVPYEGEELKEAAAYRWDVIVYNKAGAQIRSDSAVFETGVTNQEAWNQTEFIRMNKSAASPIFRTEQPLNGEVASARLYITAIGVYQAFVNGSEVGTNEEEGMVYDHMNPGYGNRNISLAYQTYDVTSSLKGSSKAVVAVNAGTGWSDGQGNMMLGATSAQPAVKAMLSITYKTGEKKVITTNTTDWKGTLQGPIVSNGVYYGEDYDARKEKGVEGYKEAGFDDSAWVSGADAEKTEIPLIKHAFATQQAQYAKLVVAQTGPATKNDNENRLQIMELELLDADGKNVARDIVPTVSDNFDYGTQWSRNNLTDGDNGLDSGKGYTSNVLSTGKVSQTLETPISIEFNLGKKVSLSQLKLYPRTQLDSISGKECPNYPKKYELMLSETGQSWTSAGTFSLETLNNTVLYPESAEAAVPYVGSKFEETETNDLRISVSATGPATANDSENRLQIMELELLSGGGSNAAQGVVPTVSSQQAVGSQWKVSNLTDGDNGKNSDYGYTSEVLDKGLDVCTPGKPLTIDFHFNQKVKISEVKMFLRTKAESVNPGICANYPKVFSIQTSEDGGSTWKNIVEQKDAGMVNNNVLAGTMQMSTTTYPGGIRAQSGSSGKILDQYSKDPVSAVLYTGKAQQSEFAAGEIAVDQYFAYEEPTDSLYQDKYEQVAKEHKIFEDGITLKKGQSMVINMGQNMTAIPELTFEAAAGTKLTMNFGEMLNDGSPSGSGATQSDGPKGSIYLKSLRGARSAVKYTFDGTGREHYQTAMSFFGYQYIGLTATDDVTIYSVRSRALSSIREQTGTIKTNNKNVNQLFSNVIYGQLSNYFTTATDCPQRDERLAWSGDIQAFAQTAVFNFDATAFLTDLQKIMSENTMIKGYVPSVLDDMNGFFSNCAAGWSDVQIILPWTMYLQTGDASIIEENWDAMTHYMNYLKQRERGTNQAPLSGDKNYGDWLSFQGSCTEVIADYYYGYVTKLMEQMAEIIEDSEKQSVYEQKFEAIKEKFLSTHVSFDDGSLVIKSGTGNTGYQFMFWAGKGGTWENNSQTSLLWMIKLGFYDSEEMRDAAIDLLVENIKNQNPDPGSIRSKSPENTLAVGFLGSNVITPILSDIGYSDVSYDLLLQDEQPSWLFEVKAGATTVWERWNSYTPGQGFGDSEMNSFNHYAYGSVVEWMYNYMAGISSDQNQPGFQHIILQPTPDRGTKYNEEERINSVEASFESVYGEIQSTWKSDQGKLTSYTANVPANTTATLYLPVTQQEMDGFKNVTGLNYVKMTDHIGEQRAEINLEAGVYSFTVKNGKVSAVSGNTTPEEKVTVTYKAGTGGRISGKTVQTITKGGSTSQVTAAASAGYVFKSWSDGVKSASRTDRNVGANKTVTALFAKKIIPVSKVTMNTKPRMLGEKERVQLTAKVSPSNADNKKLTWSTSSKAKATVSSGRVTAKKAGSVMITASASNGKKAFCTIKVKKAPKSIRFQTAAKTLKKGKTFQLKPVLSKGSASSRITYTSSSKKVASVSETGKVKALKKGKAVITAKTYNGKKAICKIAVQ